MKSVIRYFGGKGTMYNSIYEYFPDNSTYDTYIEPFGGAFSVGLQLPLDKIKPNEIYNDLEKNVYCLYKIINNKESFDKFRELCDLSIYSEDLRKEYKENLKKDDITDLERAFMFFYVNRTSHNGVGGFSTNLVVRRNMSKSVSDYLSVIERLPELHQRLSKVIILNQDGVNLVKKYNTENCFLYCDPPYVQSTRGSARYIVDMNDDKHNEFIDSCISSKAKILISGYDCELYDRLCDNGFQKVSFTVNTIDGKRNPKEKIETLWFNYNILGKD